MVSLLIYFTQIVLLKVNVSSTHMPVLNHTYKVKLLKTTLQLQHMYFPNSGQVPILN